MSRLNVPQTRKQILSLRERADKAPFGKERNALRQEAIKKEKAIDKELKQRKKDREQRAKEKRRSAKTMPSDVSYKKLSPKELEKRGFSRKSERYLGSDGSIVTKRQYQEYKRGATYTTFKEQVAKGERTRKTPVRTITKKYNSSRIVYYERKTLGSLMRSAGPIGRSDGWTMQVLVHVDMIPQATRDTYKNQIVTNDNEGAENEGLEQLSWYMITGNARSGSLFTSEYIHELLKEHDLDEDDVYGWRVAAIFRK